MGEGGDGTGCEEDSDKERNGDLVGDCWVANGSMDCDGECQGECEGEGKKVLEHFCSCDSCLSWREWFKGRDDAVFAICSVNSACELSTVPVLVAHGCSGTSVWGDVI